MIILRYVDRDGKSWTMGLDVKSLSISTEKDDIAPSPVVKPSKPFTPKHEWYLEGRGKMGFCRGSYPNWRPSCQFPETFRTRKQARAHVKRAMQLSPSYEYRPAKREVK